jgi:2-amino-4-hydroxy-6-hydroxymethyldihydropteridine diphosphokinase
MTTTPEIAIQEKPNVAFLSLGSNLGDRLAYLREALIYLNRNKAVDVRRVSSVYETDPVGYTDQPAFFNIAVEVATSLSPLELLALCQKVEDHFQRARSVRWGPRTLDIDILTYDEVVLNTPELTLPHPRMAERDFVQIPLRELRTGEIGCSETVRPMYTQWFTH